jgi:peptide/nickel transport system ATP-binding protein
MQLIRAPGKIEGGQVLIDGENLIGLSDEQMRQHRLAVIAMVAQGAMNSLNPVIRVRDQIVDALKDHGLRLSKQELEARIASLLTRVGLSPQVANMFPHELSGGMKQRVCIAIAISLRPKVIIADEPTSALDVVVQRQIMQTLNAVQKRLQASILLVGHDMGLMAKFVDRIGVMYGGKLVELGTVYDIFQQPLHPYTQLLISSLPTLEAREAAHGIPGTPPSLLHPPSGCVFHPRCPFVMPRCSEELPQDREPQPDHMVACHLYD